MAIYKKKNNWYIDYYLNGRRKRELAGPSKQQARDLEHRRLSERSEKKKFPERASAKRTFGEIADLYMRVHGQYNRSMSWKAMLPKILAEFGNKRLGDIHPADIEEFCNRIAIEWSGSTSNRYLTLIKAIYNKARDLREITGECPCDRTKKKKENAPRLRYLSRKEIVALLECTQPRIRPIIMTALYSGMRQGEILALTWDCIDIELKSIYVKMSKSGKPRSVPMSPTLREMFLKMGPKKNGPLFDVPLITLRRHFEKSLKASRIEGFRFHDLRHTFASHYIMQTRNLPALQAILGHATPSMTLRYAHLASSHLEDSMLAFETAMPSDTAKIAQDGHLFGHQTPIETVVTRRDRLL